MKKTALLVCAVILLVCSLCGCVNLPGKNPGGDTIPGGNTAKDPDDKNTEEAAFAALQKKIAQSGSAVAVAFIGYVDSESSEADLRTYVAGSETGKEYPSLSSAPLYMAEGQELYAIIPPNDKGTIIVYPSMITEDGEYADDKSNPLHVGEPGEPLLLRCNLSEIYSNVLIAATDGGGAMDFRPSLSMENGHLQEIAGVYDFSTYGGKAGGHAGNEGYVYRKYPVDRRPPLPAVCPGNRQRGAVCQRTLLRRVRQSRL